MIVRLTISCLLLISLQTSLLAEVNDDQLFKEVRPVRVVKIELYDQGNYSEGQFDLAIDTFQNSCEVVGEEPEPELYLDTLAGIYVYNKTPFAISFDQVQFIIKNINQKKYKSKKLSLASIGYVESGSTARLLALLLNVREGRKYLYPDRGPLPIVAGATNVKFILTGLSTSGEKVKTIGKIALVFRDVNRCQ